MPLITTISFYRIYDSLLILLRSWENYNTLSHSILFSSHNSRAGKEIEPDFIFVSVLSFQKGVDLLPNLHPCILPSSKQHCKILGSHFVTRLCPTYRNFRPEFRIVLRESYNYRILIFIKLFTFF